MKQQTLIIDPEFKAQIPPLTEDERKQLEENILADGEILSPILVWNDTIVDGHNRYEILQNHPEIPFTVYPLTLENREQVLVWICLDLQEPAGATQSDPRTEKVPHWEAVRRRKA